MSQVSFSVVIACHNHEAFVQSAVMSALSQSLPAKEVIVIDDASVDRTPEILKSFGASITFERVARNQGASAARNRGASLASGEYVVFLDGDDVLMSHALHLYGRLVSAGHPKIILGRCEVCGDRTPMVQRARPPVQIQFVEYPDFLSKDRPWVYNSSSLVVHRTTFLCAGGWSEEMFYQDIQDLLNKMGDSGKTVLVLEPATVWYRMHSANAIRKIKPFVQGIYVLLTKARRGLYPGGRAYRKKREAWFGGLIFYWTREAIRNKDYRSGFSLLASRWWLILLAMIRRCVACVRGRKRIVSLLLEQK